MKKKEKTYYFPEGGLSSQKKISTGRAVFKNAYAIIPKSVMQDIVVSYFPHWYATRAWVLARPLSGFSETFSQSILEISGGGGSSNPESDNQAESVLFVVNGKLNVQILNTEHELVPGSYVYIPPDLKWSVQNLEDQPAHAHWIRKKYEFIDGIDKPDPLVKNERDVEPVLMPGVDNSVWSTTRFVDPMDMRYDMHVNIVNIQPGGSIPFMETHVMEHGLYVLQGKGVYRLNEDWVEVEAGDFIWLRAFCPQACYAGGPETFRYLLYKDVNRQIKLV